MSRLDTIGFFLSAVAGFALWAFSDRLTGHAEPWDGSANTALYLLILFFIGLGVMFTSRGRIRSPYLGVVLGQIAFGLTPIVACPAFGALCDSEPNLAPLSVIVLLAYSLPALGGAALGRWVLDRTAH